MGVFVGLPSWSERVTPEQAKNPATAQRKWGRTKKVLTISAYDIFLKVSNGCRVPTLRRVGRAVVVTQTPSKKKAFRRYRLKAIFVQRRPAAHLAGG